MTQAKNREAPINIRAQLAQRQLIDKAAAMLNKNRSDFMLEVACREAESVLLDRRLFLVDDAAYQMFEALLNTPPQDNSNIRDLLTTKTPWEK